MTVLLVGLGKPAHSIFTVDINPEFTFSETLSPQVQRAPSELAELIAAEIKRMMA